MILIFLPRLVYSVVNNPLFIVAKAAVYIGFQAMLNNLKALLNLIFPNTCSNCSNELLLEEDFLCWCCEEEIKYTYFESMNEGSALDKLFWGRVKIEQTFALFYYHKKAVSQTILHEIKYGHKGHLGVLMGQKMAWKNSANINNSNIDVLIPVPTHHRKKFNRGYNQSEKIAKGISSVTGIPIDVKFLIKNKHTESQTKKATTDRWQNVVGGFSARKNVKSYKHLALVDDVITTGATLESLVKEIRKSNPSIEISIFALAMAKE